MTAPVIREAAAGDLPAMAALHREGTDDPWSAEAIGSLLAAPGAVALLAESDSGPAGFVLARAAGGEAEILALAVRPARRRCGLGCALVVAAMEHCVRAGAQVLFLEVAVDNAAALGLYRGLGFEDAGRRRGYYGRPGGAPADALVLKRGIAVARTKLGQERSSWLKSPGSQWGENIVTRIENLCADKGLRMTDQRRVIARVLSEAIDHPDAEELYRRASAIDPHISIATVYRTVKLFEDAGILERHDFRDGRSRYEEVPDSHHDHLIDIQSGRVVEFRNEEIEKLQRIIAEELGFELVDHRLELYGVPRANKPVGKG